MMLLAMKGLPGSGKSRLAKEMGRRMRWKVIDKDDIKDALHGGSSDAGRRAYTITLRQVEEALRNGESVIYDSPLTFASLYEELCALAERTGAQLTIVECYCSDRGELRRRIEARAEEGFAPHRITDWKAFVDYDERTTSIRNYPIASPHMIVDTATSLSEVTTSVLQWLEE